MGYIGEIVGAKVEDVAFDISRKIDNFFTSSDSSYTPSHSNNTESVENNTKILAKMQEKSKQYIDSAIDEILEIINTTMNETLKELRKVNSSDYGGKKLDINFKKIHEENKKLEEDVKKHVEEKMSNRFIPTDKEFIRISEIKEEKKRKKEFDKFILDVKKEAYNGVEVEIRNTVKKQNQVVKDVIQNRINEVEKSMKSMQQEYSKLYDIKKQGSIELEKQRVEYIYALGVCDVILDELG